MEGYIRKYGPDEIRHPRRIRQRRPELDIGQISLDALRRATVRDAEKKKNADPKDREKSKE